MRVAALAILLLISTLLAFPPAPYPVSPCLGWRRSLADTLRRVRGERAVRARRRAPPDVIAHRGGAGRWPENTLTAFRRSLELGVDLIELDVHRSRDGELVVLHDEILDRTTDGHGLVRDHTWAQLSGLNAAARQTRVRALEPAVQPAGTGAAAVPRGFEPLVRLGDVLELLRQYPRARALIDLKHRARFPRLVGYPGIAARVTAEVRRAGLVDRIRLAAFDRQALREARALMPEVPALLHWDHHDASAAEVAPSRLAARAARDRLTGLSLERVLVTPAMVAAAHRIGLRVDAWVVDDPEEARCFEDLGVDGLITDRPDRLASGKGFAR